MTWVQGVDLDSKLPRSQSDQASLRCPINGGPSSQFTGLDRSKLFWWHKGALHNTRQGVLLLWVIAPLMLGVIALTVFQSMFEETLMRSRRKKKLEHIWTIQWHSYADLVQLEVNEMVSVMVLIRGISQNISEANLFERVYGWPAWKNKGLKYGCINVSHLPSANKPRALWVTQQVFNQIELYVDEIWLFPLTMVLKRKRLYSTSVVNVAE